MPLSGREKATIFLSILGAEAAGSILRYLPDEMADLIAAGVNHLPTPSPDALNEVMQEFKSFLALPGAGPSVPRIEGKSKIPARKKSFAFLMYERPQLVAFLLSKMQEDQRAEVLLSLSREKATIEDLLLNMKQNPFSDKIHAGLKECFRGKLS